MAAACIGISENGSHFVDGDGQPYFWLGDTQWNLFRRHTTEEARKILECRSRQGFSFVQVMLHGVIYETGGEGFIGEAFPTKDPSAPNKAYFERADQIVRIAEECGLFLVIGLDHPRVGLANVDTARTYGRWVAERYRDCPNIIWTVTYMIPNEQYLPAMRELAAGLREVDGDSRLLTCHPDPADPVATSGIAHSEPWLDFHCIQTWAAIGRIRDSVATDVARVPPKPVVMAEGAYEGGPKSKYGVEITPLVIRRQAYWSYLTGGHHSYGYNDIWRLPNWAEVLDAPGATQLTILKKILTARSWWTLVPDQTTIEDGAGSGTEQNVAARSAEGDWLMVYVSHPCSVAVRLSGVSVSDRVNVSWVDPRTGNETPAGTFPSKISQAFTCPEGWEDALLVAAAE